jgi:hypothetical protein
MKNKLSRIPARTKIIKATTGTDWGLPLEDAFLTYCAMVEPIINYGFPLYAPFISDTWWSKLQIKQKKSLRLVTGCHAATSLDHFHQECKILPVRKHIDMLAKQFLANAMQPHPPSYAIVTAPPAPCPNMKPSLQTKYGGSLALT